VAAPVRVLSTTLCEVC